ncbi:unnamed protein product, partial [Prorocentrum cordatum]
MAQPLKQCPRTAKVAWCPTPASPSLLALGSSANSAAGSFGNDGGEGATLDFVSFDPAKPGNQMEVIASVKPERGLKFASMSWGKVSREGFPNGVLAGGLQEGVVSLWNPYAILKSKGADPGLVYSGKIHSGTVNCVEFNPFKPNLMATAGADSEVNILDISNIQQPELYKPSANNKHAGSEVLCCAWNRGVPHILCSSSNTGATVVWDLRKKAEVLTFQDPGGRQRCADVAWHPEVPTQLIVAYDDDQQPSMQMWDLRHAQYPFKETAGHSKGILSVDWNIMDPNLLVSCGKDNKIITWNIGSGTLEPHGEMTAQQWNFDVKWSPHKPGVISAASINGLVSIYSVQGQQSASAKYCPKWYKKSCGVAMGFGGRVLSFGLNKSAAAITGDAAAATTSFCHSLVVPNEPELIPEADAFETWISERKLQEYCHDKTRRGGGSTDQGLMWEMMGCQFDETGRQRVPALLGFDQDQVMQKAEQYLGQKPGKTLGQSAEEEVEKKQSGQPQAAPEPAAPAVSAEEAANIFDMLSAETEAQKIQQEQEAAQIAMKAALDAKAAADSPSGSKKVDWSTGPEAIIKQSLLVGNLTAAVECCFKNNRMAEGLLLASGGGNQLWTRARDEYLRIMGDSFLTTVGNIMTNDFDKLVASSNLNTWKETLAVLATYSGDKYQPLCEQLAARLENEVRDMLSAVICYICAGNFPKTVSIWANTRMGAQGSQKRTLQDLVEKMAVLQGATKFGQADPLFNSKLTQYAEILANSGRLTAAMRLLCLLQPDPSSSFLRDRI